MCLLLSSFFFFFSSRRRHTRWPRDWSSDVCSSDLDVVDLNLREFFYGQYKLLGSTMGSRQELYAMLELIENHNIRPLVDKTFDLEQAQKAMDYLEQGNQFGKVAIQISE